jgi:VWFA-related protein
MKRKNIVPLGICLMLLLTASGFAFQASSLTVFIEQADVTAYPAVTLQLSAWDAGGLPLADLKPEDFTLHEGDGSAFHPEKVTADTQAPLQVVLAIDISRSMSGQPLADARSAAARFLDRLGPNDQAALLAFADSLDADPQKLDAKRELPLSRDRETQYNLVESLQAGGGTPLYNAAAKAVRMLQAQPAGHRAVLLLSDGVNDPPAVGDAQEAIRLAKEARVPVFVVGLGNQIDEPYLRRLASETGGLFRAAPKSSELARLFGDMATLLKTRYTLSYTSKVPGSGQSVLIKVQLASQGATVESQLPMGPLPVVTVAPTQPEPTVAPTAAPTVAPTQLAPTAVQAATAAAPAEVAPAAAPFPWGWPVAALLAIIVVVGVVVARRPRAKAEACAKCGFDLTGVTGACPQCGEIRRLPKRK